MRTLELKLAKPYSIYIDRGALLEAGSKIRAILPGKKVAVVSDETVWSLHGAALEKVLNTEKIVFNTVVVPAGESSKSLSMLNFLYHEFCRFELRRDGAIIAFGGGVAGDLAGFAASTYMRGIGFVQIPTSLLAQVDSSVGGKVAVNLEEGKNLVGNFYQPQMVIADTGLLSTLSPGEFASGMAEVVKYAAIGNSRLLSVLEEQSALDSKLEEIVFLCCESKAAYVEKDERDTGPRMMLNFGHTFGHAIEKFYAYKKYNHGEAVAIGMMLAVRTGILLGKTKPETYPRLKSLLETFNLKTKLDDTDGSLYEILPHIAGDKKNSGSEITLVLLDEIGSPFIHKMNLNKLIELLTGSNS